ncbi:sigma-54 dependent transcriptional regulator [Desulfobaculum bizertense]|uniref:sigma-54-dependent transcriptional regulator n=1 Tax=Desulfobaculum bizertense TaxID=376490 RepID=UPI001F1F898A|nr:sigma-54 dependent transcriptional regulator [Desulfobaculum bizertense]UIJ39261.1 sigma-54 dependent transcriptional regulator [Desulfobaculum bizertense]
MKNHTKRKKQRRYFPISFGLRGRLMAALIPCVILMLIVLGMTSYGVAERYITEGIERFIRLQNLAVAHEVEGFLEQSRQDLLYAAQHKLDEESMRQFMTNIAEAGGVHYLEFSYTDPGDEQHIFLYRSNGEIRRVLGKDYSRLSPHPLLLFEETPKLAPGEVWISPVQEVRYPVHHPDSANLLVRRHVIRLVTPYTLPGKSRPGLLSLCLSSSDIRDILTLYNSKDSPIWAFPRSSELRFDYFVDLDGWMLFQSGDQKDTSRKLETYLARSGYAGTLGRPGLENAFRPDRQNSLYWNMVQEIRKGRSDLRTVHDEARSSGVKNYYFAYAPIRFQSTSGTSNVYAGLVRVDRSELLLLAGYQYLDVMLVVTILSICVVGPLIYWISRRLTAPIRELSEQLDALKGAELKEIEISYGGRDIENLKLAANNMIQRIAQQVELIRQKDATIESVNLREPADLAEEKMLLEQTQLSIIPSIIGIGPQISELKSAILKAAQVDVDVLISGQTGTGKQLVAEAIHQQSARKGNPFICINCGALDENLLLDALFGHVKGAFTEAHSDRKGAFQEANRGTLFLDEIQSASPKVQQSLLRALSVRRIKPLGSDEEISVDVRIVAATNVDLVDMIQENSFREDLYYRLKVVSLHTPPLSEHTENIPLLALHYLEQAEALTARTGLRLSKGALIRLNEYEWPGNIRELVNAITRAAVMAETDIIQAEEIRLGAETLEPVHIADIQVDVPTPRLPASSECESAAAKQPRVSPLEQFNERQQKAWPCMLEHLEFSRSEYQEFVGGELSPRTANYDLNELVSLGILSKQGKGPATRYVVAKQD